MVVALALIRNTVKAVLAVLLLVARVIQDLPGSGLALSSPMKHETLKWNPATGEWFCPACGRTSDHVSVQDAQAELDKHDCRLPSVEVSKLDPWN